MPTPSSKRRAPRIFLLVVFCITIAPLVFGFFGEWLSNLIGCRIGTIDYAPTAQESCPEPLGLMGRLGILVFLTFPIGGALLVAGLVWLAVSDTFVKPETPNKKGIPGVGAGFLIALVVLAVLAVIVWQAVRPL